MTSLSNQMPSEFTLNRDLISTGQNFVPHVLIVKEGEDVIAQITSFCQRCARDVYIASATGDVSGVSIRQFGRTLTYEGRYVILSLIGFLSPTIMHGGDVDNNLMISMAGPDYSVSAGIVSDSLIAASNIEIVLWSFTHSPLTKTSVSDCSNSETSSAESSSKKQMMAP